MTTEDIMGRISYIPCNPKNHGGRRDKASIKYLVYHYTGNDGDHDTGNARYYRDNVVKASAHYYVDDDSVTQSVGDLTVAWAVGGKKWSDCARTGGGKFYGEVTNTNSISIEMCDTSRNGYLMATEATQKNAIALGKVLMQRYSIPIERVVRHFDVTGKHCPAYFMDEKKWAAFKARLTQPDEPEEDEMDINKLIKDMTPEQAYALRKKADAYAGTRPMPQNWDASEQLADAIRNGITDGTRPMAAPTRLENALMANRAYKNAVKAVLDNLKK